jgi:hypothetical protein
VATFLRNAEHASTDQATANAGATTTCMDGKTSPLAAMHQAITYRWLLGSLDPSERSQFGSAFQDWVARALAARSLAV